MAQVDLKLPGWLRAIVFLIIFCVFIGLFTKLVGKPMILTQLADIALIFTLAAVVIYAYYSFLLAKEAWIPSASFSLQPSANDPYHFVFILQNHSKFSLSCWCKLNASVHSHSVSIEGFYDGETPYDLQPLGIASGHFDIRDLVAKADHTVEELEKQTHDVSIKQQLYFDIEFWYNRIGTKAVVQNPRQPYYFNFRRKTMIADF